jgi:hypothetical protein
MLPRQAATQKLIDKSIPEFTQLAFITLAQRSGGRIAIPHKELFSMFGKRAKVDVFEEHILFTVEDKDPKEDEKKAEAILADAKTGTWEDDATGVR